MSDIVNDPVVLALFFVMVVAAIGMLFGALLVMSAPSSSVVIKPIVDPIRSSPIHPSFSPYVPRSAAAGVVPASPSVAPVRSRYELLMDPEIPDLKAFARETGNYTDIRVCVVMNDGSPNRYGTAELIDGQDPLVHLEGTRRPRTWTERRKPLAENVTVMKKKA